jgi:hypothetical protein
VSAVTIKNTSALTPSSSRQPWVQRATATTHLSRSRSGGTIQLLKFNVQITNGVIKSVTSDGKRPGGNIRGSVGDHTTSHVSFFSMVRNQIMGKTLSDAKTTLNDLVDNLRGLPGMQIKSADYLTDYINHTLYPKITNITDEQTLEDVMEDIVSIRNQLQLSSIKNSTSTGGHGEGSTVAALDECDDRFRNGNTKPRYTEDDMAKFMWELFDYTPTDAADDDVIVNVIMQHMYSMQLTYPNIFNNIAGYDKMYNYLIGTRYKDVFAKMSDMSRVKGILSGLAGPMKSGPSALPKIGGSKKWDV